VVELYEEFTKFSKSKVLHFRKLEQQRKCPDMMKPQDQPITIIISIATPSRCTTSILMVVDLWKIGRSILDNPRKKEVS
jgi:hypothetical protein